MRTAVIPQLCHQADRPLVVMVSTLYKSTYHTTYHYGSRMPQRSVQTACFIDDGVLIPDFLVVKRKLILCVEHENTVHEHAIVSQRRICLHISLFPGNLGMRNNQLRSVATAGFSSSQKPTLYDGTLVELTYMFVLLWRMLRTSASCTYDHINRPVRATPPHTV